MAATAKTSSMGAGNGDFADRVPRGANRVSPAPNGLALALATYAALILLATLGGAFGTHQLALGPRFAFWTALILWNAMKWNAWLALLHRRLGWPGAIGLGALVLNLSLPFEARLALGLQIALPFAEFARIYLTAAAISLVSGGALILAVRYFRSLRREAVAAPPPRRTGIWTLGFDEAELWAIEAEDHYVRLVLRHGPSPLHTARFGDVLEQVAHLDGCRIHRGRWVADAAVTGAERVGRGWQVVLLDGRRLPVSGSHVGALRERAWARRRPPAGAS